MKHQLLVEFSSNPNFLIGSISPCSFRYIVRLANFMFGVPCFKGSDRNVYAAGCGETSLWNCFSSEALARSSATQVIIGFGTLVKSPHIWGGVFNAAIK
jgi:hypothetical protein